MRFFLAKCASNNLSHSFIDSREYLYEIFDRKIFLSAFRSRRAVFLPSHDFDTSFGISIVVPDTHISEQLIEDYIIQACELWDIPTLALFQVDECTFKDCFNLDFDSYRKYSDRELFNTINLNELEFFQKDPAYLKNKYCIPL